MVILAGTEAVRFSRFFERFVRNTDLPFGLKHPPDIVFIPGRRFRYPGRSLRWYGATGDQCDTLRLTESFQALRAVYRGPDASGTEVAGASIASLEALAQKIKGAKYGALVWAVADMEGPHGDLAVQAMCDLVTEINETSRFSCVPLGSTRECARRAAGVHLAGRLSAAHQLGRRRRELRSILNSWRRLLDSGEADAVLWLSAFKGGSLPFETNSPHHRSGRAGNGVRP